MKNNTKNLLLLALSILVPLYVGINDIVNRRKINTKKYILGIFIFVIGMFGLFYLIYELYEPGDMVINRFKGLMSLFFGSVCSILVGYRELLDKEIRSEAQVILDYGLLFGGVVMAISFVFVLIMD